MTHVVSYTHFWRLPIAAPFKPWCMASVETIKELEEAQSTGWRTFRATRSDDPSELHESEVWCPNAVGPKKNVINCINCMACDGAGKNSARKSIADPVHGPTNMIKSVLSNKEQHEADTAE